MSATTNVVARWSGLNPGDWCKVRNRRGWFRFVRHVAPEHGSPYVELIGGHGTRGVGICSIRPELVMAGPVPDRTPAWAKEWDGYVAAAAARKGRGR